MTRPRQYPQEMRDRAVRMVRESDERGAIARIAGQLGINKETLRHWVNQADADEGLRPGPTSDLITENRELKKQNAELRRANEILKSASAFFAKELDQPRTR